MCGRFSYWDTETIKTVYQCESDFSMDAHFNACPSSHIPVILAYFDNKQIYRILQVMRWGLVPDWTNFQDHRGFINARSETIDEKKSFKESFIMRRCIIPARGYYEWDEKKQSHYIFTESDHVAFAGIWDGSNTGLYHSIAILTGASHTLSHIHGRHPLVLKDEKSIEQWLYPTTPKDTLLGIIADCNDSSFLSYPVDKKVGNPKLNDDTLIQKMSDFNDTNR